MTIKGSIKQDQVKPHTDLPEIPGETRSADALLRQLYRAVHVALQFLVSECNEAELENLIDSLLLLDLRLQRAKSQEEKASVLEVLRPARQCLAEQFQNFGRPELVFDVDALFARLGPLMSRIPIQIDNHIYALVQFHDNEFRIKLTIDESANAATVADRVCEEMRKRKQFTAALTEDKVRRQVLSTIGPGPPYATVPLSISESMAESAHNELARRSRKVSKSNNSYNPGNRDIDFLGNDSTFAIEDQISSALSPNLSLGSSSHSGHTGKNRSRMCVECYNVRRRVQEDMLMALTQSVRRIESYNNNFMRETFQTL